MGETFTDIVPVNIGIRAYGNSMLTVVPANHLLPVKKQLILKTNRDFQTSMSFTILQGESNFAAKNYNRGTFTLDNIPAERQGHWSIKLEIEVDANGRCSARAELPEQGLEASLVFGKIVDEALQKQIDNEEKSIAHIQNQDEIRKRI